MVVMLCIALCLSSGWKFSLSARIRASHPGTRLGWGRPYHLGWSAVLFQWALAIPQGGYEKVSSFPPVGSPRCFRIENKSVGVGFTASHTGHPGVFVTRGSVWFL